jgi:hypothetical protein
MEEMFDGILLKHRSPDASGEMEDEVYHCHHLSFRLGGLLYVR